MTLTFLRGQWLFKENTFIYGQWVSNSESLIIEDRDRNAWCFELGMGIFNMYSQLFVHIFTYVSTCPFS